MSADIIPYYQLAENSTNDAVICWIDTSNTAGDEQSIEYREKDSESSFTEFDAEDKGSPPDDDGEHLYDARLSGLKSNTTYEANILYGEETHSIEFSTMPRRLEKRSELKIAFISDQHIDRNESDYMAAFNEYDIDIYCVIGDFTSWQDEDDEPHKDLWLGYWEDYYGSVKDGELIPIVGVPGNHDVGNHDWNGTGSTNPEEGWFHFWFTEIRRMEPENLNYGAFTVGDYLQLMALDDHSEEVENLGPFVDENVDESVQMVIPFHHAPIVSNRDRYGGEPDREQEEKTRNALSLIWDGLDNCPWLMTGHQHYRMKSRPLKVVDEEPSGSDYFEIDDDITGETKYYVEGDNTDEGLVQFGTGFEASTGFDESEWFYDYAYDEKQFYVITLDREKANIEEVILVSDDSGNIDFTETSEGKILTKRFNNNQMMFGAGV